MKSASQGSESDQPLFSPIQAEGGIFCGSWKSQCYSLLSKSVAEHATCRAYQLLLSTQSLLCRAPNSAKCAFCRREFSNVNVQCDISEFLWKVTRRSIVCTIKRLVCETNVMHHIYFIFKCVSSCINCDTSPLKSCIPHVHITRCTCTAYHYKPI